MLLISGSAPVLPFLMVFGIQLGVPVQELGILYALMRISIVLIKPLLATAADAFPAFRKAIFLSLLALMTTCFTAIYFIESIEDSNTTFIPTNVTDSILNLTNDIHSTAVYSQEDKVALIGMFAKNEISNADILRTHTEKNMSEDSAKISQSDVAFHVLKIG